MDEQQRDVLGARRRADELAEFIETRLLMGGADVFRVSRADLHATYVAWAKLTNERHPLDRNGLYEAIRRREGIEDAIWKSDGKAVRGFRGCSLVAEERA